MFQNQQARISLLYLPLFELLYQNLRLLSAQQYTSSVLLGLNVSLFRTLHIILFSVCLFYTLLLLSSHKDYVTQSLYNILEQNTITIRYLERFFTFSLWSSRTLEMT